MAEEKTEMNQGVSRDVKTETEQDVYVGSVKNVSEDKEADKAAKDPRRLFQFWIDFQKKQEGALKSAGVSTSASKISSVNLVLGKDGREAVKVDFVGGGGVLDTGNQVHVFRRLNRSMPAPDKIHRLMDAVRRRGWDAVMMEVDSATRDALLKACAQAGIKVSGVKEVDSKPLVVKHVYTQPQPLLKVLVNKEIEKNKELEEAGQKMMDSFLRQAMDAEEAKKQEVSEFLLPGGRRATEALWRVGSKPSDRRSELHSSRQTNNTRLMECRSLESKLLSEVKSQYNQIIEAAKQGFDEQQINLWREKYYGINGRESVEQKIAKKKEKGVGLTAAEAKLERVVQTYGIKSDPAAEALTPAHKAARSKMAVAEYDSEIAKEFRSMKTRKKAIADIKKKSVEYVCSDYRLKVLKADGRKVTPMTREKVVAKATALLPEKGKDTQTLVETQKGLSTRLKRVKQSCATAHKVQKNKRVAEKQEETKEQIQAVSEKVKKQTETQSKNISPRPATKKADKDFEKHSQEKRQELKGLQEKRKEKQQNKSSPVVQRGASMAKFLKDKNSLER